MMLYKTKKKKGQTQSKNGNKYKHENWPAWKDLSNSNRNSIGEESNVSSLAKVIYQSHAWDQNQVSRTFRNPKIKDVILMPG